MAGDPELQVPGVLVTYVDRGEKPSTLTEVEMEFDTGDAATVRAAMLYMKGWVDGYMRVPGPSLERDAVVALEAFVAGRLRATQR